jgi:hypothetical protein
VFVQHTPASPFTRLTPFLSQPVPQPAGLSRHRELPKRKRWRADLPSASSGGLSTAAAAAVAPQRGGDASAAKTGGWSRSTAWTFSRVRRDLCDALLVSPSHAAGHGATARATRPQLTAHRAASHRPTVRTHAAQMAPFISGRLQRQHTLSRVCPSGRSLPMLRRRRRRCGEPVDAWC